MTDAELQAYQTAAWATAIYPDRGRGTSIYIYLKLCGEAGEVAEMFGKRIRDGVTDEAAWRLSLLKELGDVLWYCAAIATEERTKLIKADAVAGDHIAISICRAATYNACSVIVSYIEQIAIDHDSTLAEVAEINLAKLAKRAATGTLRGSGSDREELCGKRQYPRCSCHVCGGISPAGDPPGTWFNACPLCHHKRCPHCEDHRYECTASNAPGQVGTLDTKGR